MNSTYSSIVVLAAALALPISAGAADTPPASPGAPKASGPAAPAKSQASLGRFDSIDDNKDGYISRDEAKKSDVLVKRFTELDLDRDGKLSQTELKAIDSPAAGGDMKGSSAPGSPGTLPGSGGTSPGSPTPKAPK